MFKKQVLLRIMIITILFCSCAPVFLLSSAAGLTSPLGNVNVANTLPSLSGNLKANWIFDSVGMSGVTPAVLDTVSSMPIVGDGTNSSMTNAIVTTENFNEALMSGSGNKYKCTNTGLDNMGDSSYSFWLALQNEGSKQYAVLLGKGSTGTGTNIDSNNDGKASGAYTPKGWYISLPNTSTDGKTITLNYRRAYTSSKTTSGYTTADYIFTIPISNLAIDPKVWNQITIVNDFIASGKTAASAIPKIYVNGILQTLTKRTGVSLSEPTNYTADDGIALGLGIGNANYLLGGFRVFNAKMVAKDVVDLYNADATELGFPTIFTPAIVEITSPVTKIQLNRDPVKTQAYSAVVRDASGNILTNETVAWSVQEIGDGITANFNGNILTVTKGNITQDTNLKIIATSTTKNTIFAEKVITIKAPTPPPEIPNGPNPVRLLTLSGMGLNTDTINSQQAEWFFDAVGSFETTPAFIDRVNRNAITRQGSDNSITLASDTAFQNVLKAGSNVSYQYADTGLDDMEKTGGSTYSFWFNANSVNIDNYGTILAKGSGIDSSLPANGTGGWTLTVSGYDVATNKLQLNYRRAYAGTSAKPGDWTFDVPMDRTDTNNKTWTHIAIVSKPESQLSVSLVPDIYVNGIKAVLVNRTTGAAPAGNSYKTDFGQKLNIGSGNTINAFISELRVFNKNLSESDIHNLYFYEGKEVGIVDPKFFFPISISTTSFSAKHSGINGGAVGAITIGSCDNGEWVAYNDISFSTNYNTIQFYATGGSGTVEVWIDCSRDGDALSGGSKIASFLMKNTSFLTYDWYTYTLNAPVGGTHNLFLRFVGGAGICNARIIEILAVVPSKIATLSSLTVNGNIIDGFMPDVDTYMCYTTDAVTVGCAVTDTGKATYVVNQTSTYPGAATITVTAENMNYTKTYTVNFIEKNGNDNFTFDNFVFTNEAGEKKGAKVDVQKLTANAANASLVIAVYDINGKMVDINDTKITASGTFNVTTKNSIQTGYKVRAFIWSDFIDFLPITPYSIEL